MTKRDYVKGECGECGSHMKSEGGFATCGCGTSFARHENFGCFFVSAGGMIYRSEPKCVGGCLLPELAVNDVAR